MNLVEWSPEQLAEAGLDKRRLTALVRRMRSCSLEMQDMGLSVYGESGTGYLIHRSRPEHKKNGDADTGAIVARVGQGFDGGGW